MTDMPSPARPATFTLRLTPEDRLRLERDAAGMSVGAYIRWRLFGPDTPPPRRRGVFSVKDHQALARVMSALGQSNIANNLNQIARAAYIGTLLLTPDVVADLDQSLRHIADIRAMLVRALDLSDAP